LPTWLIVTWSAGVVALVVVATIVGTARQKLVLLGVVLATLVLPIVSETLTADRYGYAWQGRYALPIAIGIPILAGWIIDASDRRSLRIERLGVTAISVGVSALLLLALTAMLASLIHGADASLVQALAGGSWAGPVEPAALVLFALAACVSLAAWLVGLSTRSNDSERAIALEAP
jgi:hypothetical protein